MAQIQIFEQESAIHLIYNHQQFIGLAFLTAELSEASVAFP